MSQPHSPPDAASPLAEINMPTVPIADVMWPGALANFAERAATAANEGLLEVDDEVVNLLAEAAAKEQKAVREQIAFYGTIDADLHSRYHKLSLKLTKDLSEDADKTLVDEQKQVVAALRDIIEAFEELTAPETLLHMTRVERERIAGHIADFLDALLPALTLCDAFLSDEITRMQFMEQWKKFAATAA